jgi:vacuolar-type H+-ATPase subunit I/STV1
LSRKSLAVKLILKTTALAVVFGCVIAAWLFVCIAFYFWVQPSQGHSAAALWTAGLNLLLVCALALLSWRPQPFRKKYHGIDMPMVMGEMVGQRFSRLMGRHTVDSLIAVLCAGFLLGFSSRLRTLLFRLLR